MSSLFLSKPLKSQLSLQLKQKFSALFNISSPSHEEENVTDEKMHLKEFLSNSLFFFLWKGPQEGFKARCIMERKIATKTRMKQSRQTTGLELNKEREITVPFKY